MNDSGLHKTWIIGFGLFLSLPCIPFIFFLMNNSEKERKYIEKKRRYIERVSLQK
jgi:hypothetical protein